MTAYFPTDDDFAEQLKGRNLYNRFSKSCYYLEWLGNWGSPKEPIIPGKYQIEHVLPQSIDASPDRQAMLGTEWQEVNERLCNTLGNLTLTGYNQEYSNRPFAVKRDLKPGGLKASHLHLNEYIADCDWERPLVFGLVWPVYIFPEAYMIASFGLPSLVPSSIATGERWMIWRPAGGWATRAS